MGVVKVIYIEREILMSLVGGILIGTALAVRYIYKKTNFFEQSTKVESTPKEKPEKVKSEVMKIEDEKKTKEKSTPKEKPEKVKSEVMKIEDEKKTIKVLNHKYTNPVLIIDEIKQVKEKLTLSEFNLYKISKKYLGLKIRWKLEVMGLRKEGDKLILSLYFQYRDSCLIYAFLTEEQEHLIKFVKKKTNISIEAIIFEIEENADIYIHLNQVTDIKIL